MKSDNYIDYQKFWADISQDEIKSAIQKNQFIICRLKYPFSPTMNIVVYDPAIKSIENMRAIFRTIEDAILFVDLFV